MADKRRAYLLSPLAEQDLENIWLYTFRTWSRDQADRYHATIMTAIEAIASRDLAGRDASGVREGYRKYTAGRHAIFYRETESIVTIVRILHQSMDVSAHMGTGRN